MCHLFFKKNAIVHTPLNSWFRTNFMWFWILYFLAPEEILLWTWGRPCSLTDTFSVMESSFLFWIISLATYGFGQCWKKNETKQQSKNPSFDPAWFSNLSFQSPLQSQTFRSSAKKSTLTLPILPHSLQSTANFFSVNHYTKINELSTSDFSGYISITVFWAQQAFHRVYSSWYILTSLILFFPVYF